MLTCGSPRSWPVPPPTRLYESDVADAIAVAEAGLVIENGAGYDTFLSQPLGATHPGRVVISVQHVLGAAGPDMNPHFWHQSREPSFAAPRIRTAR